MEPDEVAELVAAAAGHELDADGLALAGGLATETGGNPFFVGEILRNLIESGAITFDETARRWSVDRRRDEQPARERPRGRSSTGSTGSASTAGRR